MTKTLLIVAMAKLALGLAFVTGLINVQSVPALYVALPAGAVVFGLFLISKLLEQESALFDQEQRTVTAQVDRPAVAERVCCNPPGEGQLVSSH